MTPKRFLVVRNSAPDDALRGAVVAIGNFDGVHRGHRAVIALARTRAEKLARPATVLTFEPHPRAFFHPHDRLFRLTPEAAKLRLLAATGLDGAIVLTFDAALASLTAEEFVSRILIKRFAVSGVVIGFNFHFGAGRGGSPQFLKAQGERRDFAVDIVPPLMDRGRPVASGPVREALGAGHVEEAADLLGYSWFVSGTVGHGSKRGRQLGFPTANIALDPNCGLRHGIYAVRAQIEGRCHDGVASFGRRPMFENAGVLLEIFLFDFSGDLYGRSIDVAFIGFIREEAVFDSLDDLKRRMEEDARQARAMLARVANAFPP